MANDYTKRVFADDDEDQHADADVEGDEPQEDAPGDEPEKEDEKEEQDLLEEPEEDSESEDDQRKKFGQRAERRIKGLVRKTKEYESALVQEREEKSKLEREIAALKSKTSETEDLAFQQFETSLASEEAALQAAFKAAHEDGDSVKSWEVVTKIGELQAKKALMNAEKSRRARARPQKAEADEVVESKIPPHKTEAVDPRQLISDRTVDWMKQNRWFGQNRLLNDGTMVPNSRFDQEMTAAAFDIHADLMEEGITEVDDADEYFAELDARMKATFPKKFSTQNVKSNVAGAGRGTSGPNKKGGKVRLTRDQLEFCSRNSIDPVKYAKELASLEA